jgi:hypothetical protein
MLLGNQGDSIRFSAIYIDKAIDFGGTPNGSRIYINGGSWKNVNYSGVAYAFNWNNTSVINMKNVGVTLQNGSPGALLVQAGATNVIVKDCPGINPQPVSGTLTAGASPYTVPALPYPYIFSLVAANGLSAGSPTLDGVAVPQTVGLPIWVEVGHTLILTWVTTAPTFKQLPQ